MIGKSVLHYNITAKLGQGGMGAVYLALDTRLNRQVALKFLPKEMSSDREARLRLLREAQAASQLSHPNIVTIYSVEADGGQDFIAMEYIKGVSLEEYIAAGGHSPDDILDVAVQVVEGLDAAHRAGIVHRDLKPTNIALTTEGKAKILDFGLARISGAPRLSRTGLTMGTLAYCSPEQAQGCEVDQRSDLFSFGTVLYELITSCRPFRGQHEAAIIYAIVNEMPEPLARYNPNASEDLQRVVSKCLAKRPEERYESAADLLLDLRAIRGGATADHPEATHTPRQPVPSIAVLPLTNISADREQDYFCDGITEEIIHALTRVEGMRVVARTSVFAFRDKSEDIRSIGHKLSADVVLEGSVRSSGERVRINVQLINVADGYHIWSERYDREMKDVFAIQDEITLAIVDKLKGTLLAEEKARVVRRNTDDLEAFHLYLEGRYYWNRRFEGGLQRGIECFQRAISRDPLYATAYSGISDCYNVLGYFGALPPQDVYGKSKSAAARAIQIDEGLAEAHASMGWVKTYFDWDWEGGAAEYNRAIQLDPQYATAHEWYALYLCITARFDEAVAEVKRAQELDPYSLIVNAVAGVVLYMARRYDEAITQQEKVIRLDPSFALAYWFQAGSFLERSLWGQAIAALERQIALSGPTPMAMGALGMTYGRSGQAALAREILARLRESKDQRYVSPFYEALIHSGLGEFDHAFDQLERAFDVRESLLVYLNVWPFLDVLRIDPRFDALLNRLSLHS